MVNLDPCLLFTYLKHLMVEVQFSETLFSNFIKDTDSMYDYHP